MAMTVGSRQRDPEVMIDINTTPLIDVMLVLIIMLIITIPIQTHAVKLNMPAGTPPPPATPPQVVTIDIDFDGTLIWNGETLSGRPELEARLRGAAASADQPELHLRPNNANAQRTLTTVTVIAGPVLGTGAALGARHGHAPRVRGPAASADQRELHLRPNKLVKYRGVGMVMPPAQKSERHQITPCPT